MDATLFSEGSVHPLAGVRVVDAATILAGPFAASVLGEFGAEVVKVEQPGVGDPMRRLGTVGPGGDTWWWRSDTRNKRSVEIDLRTDEGADAFRALVDRADVLVENYRTGTMEGWASGSRCCGSATRASCNSRSAGMGARVLWPPRLG